MTDTVDTGHGYGRYVRGALAVATECLLRYIGLNPNRIIGKYLIYRTPSYIICRDDIGYCIRGINFRFVQYVDYTQYYLG